MRRTYFLLLVFSVLLFNQNTIAQCFPNANYASESFGLYPTGDLLMDCSGTSASKTLVCLTDSISMVETSPGDPDTLQSYFEAMRIVTVEGLPPGLTVSTDVINTATQDSPYGIWLNNGTAPNLTPAIGCFSIVGSPTDWTAASTGGVNNDGVYQLVISYDLRMAMSIPDISFLVPNGTWVSDATGIYNDFELNIELRVNESACVGGSLFVSPQVTADDADTPSCDGQATVEVFNGTPPYSYNFSTGDSTQTASNLCSGIYSVVVEDAVGSQSTSQFAIASSTNVYSNVPVTVPNVPGGIDTLYGSVNTCDLDYNLPIDSFYVANVVITGIDTLLASWIVWQLGMPFTVTTINPFTVLDPTVFSASLWCLNGRAEAGIFQLFDLYDLSSVGVDEAERLNLALWPNPSNGLFEIQLNTSEKINLRIMDVSGKILQSKQLTGRTVYQLDLQSANPGMYFLEIASTKGRTFKRLVKN